MSGEDNLDTLIKTMSAALHDELFVFVTLKNRQIPIGLIPHMQFREAEGQTLIVTQAEAEAHHLAYEFPCRMITLNVHSALDAVGFLARITTALAREKMGVNPVSGFYHDHLFVPEGRAQDAMEILRRLSLGEI